MGSLVGFQLRDGHPRTLGFISLWIGTPLLEILNGQRGPALAQRRRNHHAGIQEPLDRVQVEWRAGFTVGHRRTSSSSAAEEFNRHRQRPSYWRVVGFSRSSQRCPGGVTVVSQRSRVSL
jgi:hypothetical protein